jgi:transposase InsO family protein
LRYAFIAEHQHTWPVAVLCEVLEVSRSGFYAYLLRHARVEIDAEKVVVLARGKAIAANPRHSYGSRRIAKQLQDEGFAVGRAKARRLMHQAGVVVQRPTGLLHHSGRGSQYTSHAYQDLLADYGIVCSISGKGACLDNAVAERCFGSLKRE